MGVINNDYRFANYGVCHSEDIKQVKASNPFLKLHPSHTITLPKSFLSASIEENHSRKRKVTPITEENSLSKCAKKNSYLVNLTYLSGTVYQGNMVEDKPHEKGKFISRDGANSLEFDFIEEQSAEKVKITYSHSGMTYEGQVKIVEGKPIYHGQGKLLYADGTSFEGTFQDGVRQGRGRLFSPTVNRTFEAVFINDEIDRTVKVTLFDPTKERLEALFNREHLLYTICESNGYIYTGEVKRVDGKVLYHGKGMLLDPEGSCYWGEFKDGLRHGKGRIELNYDDAENFFEGEFEEDVIKKGKLSSKIAEGEDGNDGDVYEGDCIEYWYKWITYIEHGDTRVPTENWFLTIKSHGQGEMTREGNVYQGRFVEGVCCEGKITYANGNVYEGQLDDEEPDGQGKMMYANGSVYEGQFENGQRYGQGTYISHDGWTYEGQFENNAVHGQGKMIYANGDIYEGQFENNVRHGQGTYTTFREGRVHRIYKGGFQRGLSHGEGVMFENGRVHTAQFVEGKMCYPIILPR